jgi:hypothetical protein
MKQLNTTIMEKENGAPAAMQHWLKQNVSIYTKWRNHAEIHINKAI